MSATKATLINNALSRIGISGVTSSPDGTDYSLALPLLEQLVASWQAYNIDLPYNYEETPNLASPHNLSPDEALAVESVLALRLAPRYNINPSPSLQAEASAATTALMVKYAKTKQISYPGRMPYPSHGPGYRHTYSSQAVTELYFDRKVIFIDDTVGFFENFTSKLDTYETISSVSTTSSTNLTVQNLTSTDKTFSFLVQGLAVGLGTVTVTVASSTGKHFTLQYSVEVLEASNA